MLIRRKTQYPKEDGTRPTTSHTMRYRITEDVLDVEKKYDMKAERSETI